MPLQAFFFVERMIRTHDAVTHILEASSFSHWHLSIYLRSAKNTKKSDLEK
jgi:hypothetical protein